MNEYRQDIIPVGIADVQYIRFLISLNITDEQKEYIKETTLKHFPNFIFDEYTISNYGLIEIPIK